MNPILDPRDGDVEDDASSTHQRSLLSLAGTLLGEISLPKLLTVWFLLLLLPALALGLAPLLATAWAMAVWTKTAGLLTGIGPALLLPPLFAIGWFGGRRVLHWAESGFWSLNAMAVQPIYVIFREGLRHLVEAVLPTGLADARRGHIRAACAVLSGVALCLAGLATIGLVWDETRWVGRFVDLAHPRALLPVVLANSVAITTAYCAITALVWGIHDALMAQPRDLDGFASPQPDERTWRVAHLSDLHTVGERYGFRIESGRAGPRGNDRLRQTLARLDALHRADPLDIVLITGDLTDAGRPAEWAEFMIALADYPDLAARVVAMPGNHDVNVVDRASPARMDTPLSPTKRLRQMRTLSALEQLQGERMLVVEDGTARRSLSAWLRPRAARIAAFADTGGPRTVSAELAQVWNDAFPMVLPPDAPDGLGVIALDSNADTHFSFTNALGLVSAEQMRRVRQAAAQYPRACWIIALHHHVVEYPSRAKLLSLRIGTALINGSWVVRQLWPLGARAVAMHGHRHIDWVGQCGPLKVVSAPSPVMAPGAAYFHVHTLAIGSDGALRLRPPRRVAVDDAA